MRRRASRNRSSLTSLFPGRKTSYGMLARQPVQPRVGGELVNVVGNSGFAIVVVALTTTRAVATSTTSGFSLRRLHPGLEVEKNQVGFKP
jgi:hypothetical protein